MNKLELEMTIQRMKFSREICENLISLNKNSLFLNRFATVTAMLVAFALTFFGVHNLLNGRWVTACFEFVMVAINLVLGFSNIDRIRTLKIEVESGEVELERLSSEIQRLKEMVV